MPTTHKIEELFENIGFEKKAINIFTKTDMLKIKFSDIRYASPCFESDRINKRTIDDINEKFTNI